MQLDFKKIEEKISNKITDKSHVRGGCINETMILGTSCGNKYFLKTNSDKSLVSMFLKEKNGLKEIEGTETISVPKVIDVGVDYLLLEYVENGKKTDNFFEDFGFKLAKLHKTKRDYFGFTEDNFIGSTIQKNTPRENDWSKFFYQSRLMFQLELIEKKGLATKELINLLVDGKSIIIDKLQEGSEDPTVLHGDLWGGNYIVNESGEACLIDPAVYFGNREADLAMTKIFGGFTEEFYKSYEKEYPLKAGYQNREPIYKLYHIMNHLNIFGNSYLRQCINLLNVIMN